MLAKKRILIVIAVLMLSLSLLLCSCDETQDPIATDVTTTEQTPDESTTVGNENAIDPENIQIKIEKDENDRDAVNFQVIRPDGDDSKSASVLAAQAIRDGIDNLLGVAPRLGNDFIKNAEHDPDTLEILVGITNYDQTAEVVKESPSYGDYSIKVVGNKIVVVAYNNNGYSLAANALVNGMREGFDEATNTITLKASEINCTVNSNKQLAKLPIFEGGVFEAYYDAGERVSGERCDEIIIDDATPELYDAYLKKLEANGYKQYTTHEANKNKFATYNSADHTVTVGFYDYEDTVRIMIEPLAPAVGLKDDNKYTKVTTSQIGMLGLETTASDGSADNSNGLCMVIRLEDGRFIVVDGGFNRSDNTTQFIKLIKNMSKEYTTTPTVAAWIVTHSHGDHQGMIGNSGKVSTIKNSGIKIESFMTNFMSEAERSKSMSALPDNWSSNEGGGYTNVWTTAKTFGSTVYKVHVGQIFYIADLELEVLYTLESFAPKVCNALNTTSLIMKMTFGGKTTYLSTGDATGNGMEIAAKMYGTYMNCDIVQVCHHGYSTWGNNSGVIKGYQATNATLVLWPQGIRAFPNYVGKDYNAVLFTQPNYKECYIAGAMGDVTLVDLPYVYGQSTITGPHKHNK